MRGHRRIALVLKKSKKLKKDVQNVEKHVPLELFLEVLEKYRASESEVISEYWGDSEHLENLEKEIAEYKKRAGIEE